MSSKSILKITWEIEGSAASNCYCTEGWKKGVWYACVHDWTTDVSDELLGPCVGAGIAEGTKWQGEVRLPDCDLDGKIRVYSECSDEEQWYAELINDDDERIWAVCLDESHGAHKGCKGVDATEDNVLENSEWFSDSGLDCNDSSGNKLNLKIEVTMNHCCLDCRECCFHHDTELEFEWEGETCWVEVVSAPETDLVLYGKLVIPKTEMKSCEECHCEADTDLLWVSKGPVTIERVLSGTCGATASVETGKYIFVKSACKSLGEHMWEFQIRDDLEICPPATYAHPNEAFSNHCGSVYAADSEGEEEANLWKRVADEDLPYTEGCDGVVMDGTVDNGDMTEACKGPTGSTTIYPSGGEAMKTIKATLTVLKNTCCKDLDAPRDAPLNCPVDIEDCPCFVRNAMIPATNDCDLYS